MFCIKKSVIALFFVSLVLISQNFAQGKKDEPKKVNFSHSSNPPVKTSKKINKNETEKPVVSQNPPVDLENKTANQGKLVTNPSVTIDNQTEFKSISIANKTRKVATIANKENLSPTEIYKVGVGDVLFINLQNSNAKYYTVLIDGTIDYPLAGTLVSVIDLTTDEIEDLLREKIKLYEDPQVTVKVREFVSHKITVEGEARAGDYFLQREAMPLFVIKNMVNVNSIATKVIIKREKNEPKIFKLDDKNADSFLIEKGDHLTFENENQSVSVGGSEKFYFLGEKICSGGKKNFHKNITLIQAIFEACGELNNKLKTIKIMRKTDDGKFIFTKHNLKEILAGKETDPMLLAGDMIDLDK